ncbi:fatty-acid peroxygenase [Psychrobacillus sp. OK028]|uniref:cytochrome P450 n=1 Tax=Psychrobacillus sp. OK028 TaxID=1884359 RepID=UPI000888EDB2|nr:cytochrome P450 [Psychrobacillus sp. OK028]SDN58091.1 fatty-acid peroxygenase [Psychrobacillus sp. OK028]
MMNQFPREEGLDHSLNLLREGYMYIPNRKKSFASNVFETRLLGQNAICMSGEKAAEIFYDEEKFMRNGVAPKRLQKTLFGEEGVQTLDDAAHRHRKSMFMALMTKSRLEALQDITEKQWRLATRKWEQMEQIVLYDEAKEIMCRIACVWAGVPVEEGEIKELAEQLAAMFESPTALGPQHWKGRRARKQVEKWVEGLVDQVREGHLNPAEGTALHEISLHKDLEGEYLEGRVAAVEVINILRPIVAIAIYINFTALAIHHYPEQKEKLETADAKYFQMFVQEVRRFYPFFPMAAAKVRKDFSWEGYLFKEGTLTLLDLYGTNHDTELWDNPDIFNPYRFSGWDKSPFDFIPQGGGDYMMGHRCAGEFVTIEIMEVSLNFLVNNIMYQLPEQDLSYSLVTMPSIPKSGVIMRDIRVK